MKSHSSGVKSTTLARPSVWTSQVHKDRSWEAWRLGIAKNENALFMDPLGEYLVP